MKKFFSVSVFLFFFLLLIAYHTSSVFAQGACAVNYAPLSLTPTSVSLGTKITLSSTITICKYPDNFRIHIVKTSGGTTGLQQSIASVFLNIATDTKCSIKPESGDAFVNTTCAKNGTGTTFSMEIDTNNVQADPNATQDFQYKVYLAAATGGELKSSSFTIQAPKQSQATFMINSFTPDPANPGDKVKIQLSGTKAETYQFGISGQSLSSTPCTGGACILELQLPAIITNPTVTILVRDSSGDKTKTLSLVLPTVQVINPGQTGVTSTPANTPKPTRPPKPPPPCTKWVDGSGNPVASPGPQPTGDLRCAEVATSLGINIGTEPMSFIRSLFSLLLSISGGIALILIIIAGYQLMTSQGDPEAIKGAKETITSAIIGLLFIIFALALLQFITIDILRIPGFSR